MSAGDGRRPDREPLAGLITGALDDEERERLEEKALLDDATFDALERAEDDVLDELARGELAPGEAERVRSVVAASERLQGRAAFARALAERVDRGRDAASKRDGTPTAAESAARRDWAAHLRWAAVIALALGVAGLWLSGTGEQTEPAGSTAQAPVDVAVGSTPSEQGPAVVLLTLDVLRGEHETSRHVIPADAETIELRLDPDGDVEYSELTVTVLDRDGEELWRADGLTTTRFDWGEGVAVELPADLLADGRYQVELRGVEADGEWRDVGFYDLRLERREP